MDARGVPIWNSSNSPGCRPTVRRPSRPPPAPDEGAHRIVAKLTGERPMAGSTPDSLLALHDAGYREVAARLGRGLVVDVGCGVGAQTALLVGSDRTVVGVDY